MDSLWGEQFNITEDIKALINKTKKKKAPKTTEQLLRSKVADIEDKLKAVREDVLRILGRHIDDIIIIQSEEELIKYFDVCEKNKLISIDTETNNTFNTFDCKLIGLCIATIGQKWAYVPVNHIDRLTGDKLPNQVTEEQIKKQLERTDKMFTIFHNASFDVEVLMTTCGYRCHVDWDTMIAAQMIDENEPKSLKEQYRLHVDSTHDKYDIEHLFKGLKYEIVPIDLFALYAGADPGMTLKLYQWQKSILTQPDLKDVYNLYRDIEIPCIDATIDMEMNGVTIDTNYAKKMSIEYHRRSDEIQAEIDKEIEKIQPIIDAWRLTPEANSANVTSNGKRGKSKSEQLKDPPELSSTTQLAIILYDILKVPVLDKKQPRATGKEILEELSYKYKLCELLLDKRKVDILIDTFIDKLQEIIQKDGKIHPKFNQVGTATGRFSSNDPNMQNIPSKDKLVRMLFNGSTDEYIKTSDTNTFDLKIYEEVQLVDNSWKLAKNLQVGDKLLGQEEVYQVSSISIDNYDVRLGVV